MPPQRGTDVVAGPAVSGPQVDRRVPADASRGGDRGRCRSGTVRTAVGLIRGEWIAVDGSKFRAVASAGSVRERQALESYLDSWSGPMRSASRPRSVGSAGGAGEAEAASGAGGRLHAHGRFVAPAYNVQTAVDAEHALIVAHAVTLDAGDNRQLEPMAEAAKKALGADTLNIVADAGYSNGEQAAAARPPAWCRMCLPTAPSTIRAMEPCSTAAFSYQLESDSFLCPADKTVQRKQLHRADSAVLYQASAADCGACSLKPRCTSAQHAC